MCVGLLWGALGCLGCACSVPVLCLFCAVLCLFCGCSVAGLWLPRGCPGACQDTPWRPKASPGHTYHDRCGLSRYFGSQTGAQKACWGPCGSLLSLVLVSHGHPVASKSKQSTNLNIHNYGVLSCPTQGGLGTIEPHSCARAIISPDAPNQPQGPPKEAPGAAQEPAMWQN